MMQVAGVPYAVVPHVWPEVWPVLRPAVERDKRRSMMDVFGQLASGELWLWRLSGDPDGLLVTTVEEEPGTCHRRIFWIVYAAGVVATKAGFGEVMDFCERQARGFNCSELKMEGRKGWERLFPEFECEPQEGGFIYRKVL